MANKNPPATQEADDLAAKVGALRYLMIGLLQRLDADKRIELEKLIAGVHGDRAAIDPAIPDHAFIEKIFSETLDILRFAANVRKTAPKD